MPRWLPFDAYACHPPRPGFPSKLSSLYSLCLKTSLNSPSSVPSNKLGPLPGCPGGYKLPIILHFPHTCRTPAFQRPPSYYITFSVSPWPRHRTCSIKVLRTKWCPSKFKCRGLSPQRDRALRVEIKVKWGQRHIPTPTGLESSEEKEKIPAKQAQSTERERT